MAVCVRRAGDAVRRCVRAGSVRSQDEAYFLFVLQAYELDRAAFDRCRADAEAVLATFSPVEPNG